MHGLAKDAVLSLKLAGNSRSGTSWQAVHASRFPCASPSGKAEGSADIFICTISTISIMCKCKLIDVITFKEYVGFANLDAVWRFSTTCAGNGGSRTPHGRSR